MNGGLLLQPIPSPWQRIIAHAVFILIDRFGIPVSGTGLLRRELQLHPRDFAALLLETGQSYVDWAFAEVQTKYATVRVRPWT